MPTLEEWGIIIGIVLGAWGAVISTILGIRELMSSRPSVSAHLSMAVAGFTGPMAPAPTTNLSLEFVNHGDFAITISAVSLVLPNKKEHVYMALFPPQPLPFTLGARSKLTHLVNVNQVAGDLTKEGFTGQVRLRAKARDATGRSYKSKGKVFDIASKMLS